MCKGIPCHKYICCKLDTVRIWFSGLFLIDLCVYCWFYFILNVYVFKCSILFLCYFSFSQFSSFSSCPAHFHLFLVSFCPSISTLFISICPYSLSDLTPSSVCILQCSCHGVPVSPCTGPCEFCCHVSFYFCFII